MAAFFAILLVGFAYVWYRGDLDWVVMKALEKDRARRYETASALAMDISVELSAVLSSSR